MKENNLKNENKTIDFNKLLVFIFLIIVVILLIYKILFHKNNEESFLKEYQDIIIVIQNKPNMNSNNSIYLTNLKDLISISLNNNLNIFNYNKNYYTIIDNTYYVYILKISKDIKN